MASGSLSEYDIEVANLSLLTVETNTYFKVVAKDGRKYALRIYSDEETTFRENRAELFWLEALMRDTDIRITCPVARTDGEYLSIVNRTGLPAGRRCVLFEWVPGTVLEKRLSPDKYRELGRIMAVLHNHAEQLKVPAHIRPKRWDKVFYYPDEPVIIFDSRHEKLFDKTRRRILEKAIVQCTKHLDLLYGGDLAPILVHGDLHYANVHVYRGRLYIIDFEDIMFGQPVQDIAVTLYYGRDRVDYSELRAAFEEGYVSKRPWPVMASELIESQMAARAIMFVNYVARISKSPGAFVDTKCRELADYLDSGQMWIGKR